MTNRKTMILKYYKKETIEKGIKKCSKCGRILPKTPEYFTRDRSKKDGLRSECKECDGRVFTINKKSKTRAKSKYIKAKVNFDINLYNNVEVLQKFRKMYLENALPYSKLIKETSLSANSIRFLIEILDIKLSNKQINERRRKNRIEYFNSFRPSKQELEKMYDEVKYSIGQIKKKYFPKIPHLIVSQWFKDYKIPVKRTIKFIDSEDRLKKIIQVLEKKKI